MRGVIEKIIVGLDESDEARDALALGKALAELEDAVLIVAAIRLFEPLLGASEDHEARVAEHFDRLFANAEHELEGTVFERREINETSASRGLHRIAAEENAELIVIGSRRRDKLGRQFPRCVAERLLDGAPCPVVVSPYGLAEAGWRLRRVGVAYDASDDARVALHHAAALAHAAGVPLRAIGVVDPFVPAPFDLTVPREVEAAAERGESVEERRRRILEEHLQEAVGELPPTLEADYEVLEGDPPEQLISTSSRVDLLVLGSRGHGAVRRAFLGSVSAAVIRGAHCPTLVVPRGIPDRRGATRSGIPTASADRG